jgi:hypothetical protein
MTIDRIVEMFNAFSHAEYNSFVVNGRHAASAHRNATATSRSSADDAVRVRTTFRRKVRQ